MECFCLCLNTPVATWGQLSRASCEDLPTPASLHYSPVFSALAALTSLSSAASTPHSHCCEPTHTCRDCSSFLTYQILVGLRRLAHAICCILYNLMNSKYHHKCQSLCCGNVMKYISLTCTDRVTYLSLNISSLRLSRSFSSSLLC